MNDAFGFEGEGEGAGGFVEDEDARVPISARAVPMR